MPGRKLISKEWYSCFELENEGSLVKGDRVDVKNPHTHQVIKDATFLRCRAGNAIEVFDRKGEFRGVENALVRPSDIVHRRILTGGSAKHGRYYQPPHVAKSKEAETLPWSKPRSLAEDIYEARQRSKPFPRRHFLEAKMRGFERASARGDRRGSLMRGWSARAPRGVSERQQLYKACGQKCYLASPTSSKTGRVTYRFPICGACFKGKCECAIDPRGLAAAERRAKILVVSMARRGDHAASKEYQRIADRARQLMSTHHGKPKSRSPTPSGRRRSTGKGKGRVTKGRMVGVRQGRIGAGGSGATQISEPFHMDEYVAVRRGDQSVRLAQVMNPDQHANLLSKQQQARGYYLVRTGGTQERPTLRRLRAADMYKLA